MGDQEATTMRYCFLIFINGFDLIQQGELTSFDL